MELDNETHLLFQPQQWSAYGRPMMPFFFQNVKPALQLATLFMTTPVLSGFWMRLAFGKVTQDARTGKRFAAIPDGGETFTTWLTFLEECAKWIRFDTDETNNIRAA